MGRSILCMALLLASCGGSGSNAPAPQQPPAPPVSALQGEYYIGASPTPPHAVVWTGVPTSIQGQLIYPWQPPWTDLVDYIEIDGAGLAVRISTMFGGFEVTREGLALLTGLNVRSVDVLVEEHWHNWNAQMEIASVIETDVGSLRLFEDGWMIIIPPIPNPYCTGASREVCWKGSYARFERR